MTMLTKMVEAMRAELARQCQQNGDFSGPRNSRPDYLDGNYDQALVARAALQAIMEPSEAMTKACCWDGVDVGEWQSGLDTILGEDA